jgi:hypothetical protein
MDMMMDALYLFNEFSGFVSLRLSMGRFYLCDAKDIATSMGPNG